MWLQIAYNGPQFVCGCDATLRAPLHAFSESTWIGNVDVKKGWHWHTLGLVLLAPYSDFCRLRVEGGLSYLSVSCFLAAIWFFGSLRVSWPSNRPTSENTLWQGEFYELSSVSALSVTKQSTAELQCSPSESHGLPVVMRSVNFVLLPSISLMSKQNLNRIHMKGPVPVAALSKVWVCGCLPAEIVGSNTTVGVDVCLLWVLCVVR